MVSGTNRRIKAQVDWVGKDFEALGRLVGFECLEEKGSHGHEGFRSGGSGGPLAGWA